MGETARAPLQIVEIDLDYCTRSYGTSPCTAALGGDAVRKCYNTFFTCQDRGNFNGGTLTLRFAKNQDGLPKGQTIFPALQSVSTNPTQITLAAVDGRTGSLGKRARVSIRLKDFAYGDALTDKYAAERVSGAAQTDEAGYDPATRGTFFGKLRARHPYYFGRAVRVRNGYVGDDIASMPALHYVITDWKGPDAAGNVELTAQDPLKLADKDFALCPKPTGGKIPGDVDESATPVFSLEPAGIGAEYDASGYARIGSEIVSFTRAGDSVTITARGQGGSLAESHTAGDTFQQCYSVANAEPADVIEALLRDFADVPAVWLDTPAWHAEIRRWAANMRLTRIVTEPTPVIELLGQIMDMGFVLWSDVARQKISLRANRPADVDEAVPKISDVDTVIEGSAARADLSDQRLTQVWAIHGMINFAEGQTDVDNYRIAEVLTDLQAEGATEYDQSRIHQVYFPWLGRASRAFYAQVTADRLLTRYRDTPQEVSFLADIRRKGDLEIAALISMESRLLQDETGASLPSGMQVVSVDEVDPGHRIKIVAQSHTYDGRWGWLLNTGYSADYDGASAAEIAEGCFMIDSPTFAAFPDGTGPYIMF